ncbi:MAG: beta strand repeat-containing protein [Pseudanabaena sp.]
MLVPSLLFILVMAIVAVAIAIVAIARSKMLNKLFKRLLIGCLSLILFVTSPLLIIPLNLQNDAVFAAGNDPCATPGKDGPATVTGIVNTYFSAGGGANLSSGATSITLGATKLPIGNPDVTVGDLLLIIQMQDADINSSNTDAYGDNTAGDVPAYTGNNRIGPAYNPTTNPQNADTPPSTGASGSTNLNSAGLYEFVTVTATPSGGGPGATINIKGTNSGGLVNTYRNSGYVAGSNGKRTYQIIRVPQYSSATLSPVISGVNASVQPWDGTLGGVFAIDVAGQITLGGGTVVDLRGKGFRGGGGRQLLGDGSVANTDFVTFSTNNVNGSKGESVAGTPRYVHNYYDASNVDAAFQPATPNLTDTGIEGYPNGSYGRGAPANGGGGSTDGRPDSNDENSGGGGGGNGGRGGRGGRAWNSQVPSGGFGGTAFTNTQINSGQRLFMGGGGGAGTTNNNSRSTSRTPGTDFGGTFDFDIATPGNNEIENATPAGIFSSGGNGGGIAIFRVDTIAGGPGTVDVRGVGGLGTGRDGGGGGGAGGTLYAVASDVKNTGTTGIGNLLVNAAGGDGGWATFRDAHGPGGGGGGGVVISTVAGVAVTSVAGGAGGQTGLLNNVAPRNFYADGGEGFPAALSASNSPGIQSGAQCSPVITVTKTTSTPTIVKPASADMTATYKIVVSNAALKSSATNVSISDVLPSGFTFAATQPAQTVTCSAGASGPYCTPANIVNPLTGATTVSWGTFTIPEAESVTIDFNVNIPNAQALGTYQNPATATYDDPARTVANGTTTASYDTTDTGEDVTITAAPQNPVGQCISPLANFNSSSFALNTPLQSSFPLLFYGGAISFSASLSGTATWNDGVQVRSDAGPAIGDYLYLQPRNAPDYLNNNNEATYVLTFPTPLTNFSMVVGGLNNNDGTTVTAFNGATPIPITAANFSALSSGMSIVGGNTVFSSITSGGTSVDTNTYFLAIPGPVTNVTVVSGKNQVNNNAAVTIGFTTFNICYSTISGTVFRDIDGSKLQNGGEVGTNAGGLNAVLVNSSNQVVATTAVATNGTYSFNNVVPGTFTVRITTNTPTVGLTPPAITLPTGWVSTGENLNGVIEGGPADSIISVTVTPANITGINLGIEELPTAVGGTAASQANPTGTNTVTVDSALFTGSTDPDGSVASYKITAFPSNTTSITINGTNYTSATFPAGGVTVTTAQLAGILIDPINGAVTVGIPFQAIDNAGQTSSNTSTVNLPFTAVASNPNLLLVKRITAINDAPITTAVNDGVASADDNANWRSTTSTTPISPTPPNDYLKGDITRNDVKPGDRIEYTIYFLSAGDTNITSVTICDLIPPNTTFVNNAYDVVGGGSNLGVVFANSTITPTSYLTGLFDSDQAKFYPANTVPPTTCKNPTNNANLTSADNTDGIVVVDVIASPATLPFATGIGTPANSYGLVRFQVKVK